MRCLFTRHHGDLVFLSIQLHSWRTFIVTSSPSDGAEYIKISLDCFGLTDRFGGVPGGIAGRLVGGGLRINSLWIMSFWEGGVYVWGWGFRGLGISPVIWTLPLER